MTYANPNVPIPPNPVFIDKAIVLMQQQFANLSWLQKSFGRSYIKVERRGSKEFKTPMVYGAAGEYVPVEFNDNLKAQSFFEVGDQTPTGDYEVNDLNYFDVKLGIIFWVNFNKIDKPKGQTYYFTEELKRDIRGILRDYPWPFKVVVDLVEEDTDNIWRNYSFKQIDDKQYFSYPHASFKFNITISIIEEC